MGRYWCRKNPTCLHTSKRMHFIEDGHTGVQASPKPRLHTSKRMHFIEEFRALPHSSAKSTCIRQNVCTSLRRSPDRMVAIGLRCLHTSKRMHFIEDPPFGPSRLAAVFLHTSKRMHFIEEFRALPHSSAKSTCIRQNVCTSLRRSPDRMVAIGLRCLHTSKRMHFIEDPPFGPSRLAAVFLHTSKRMHFIEELMIFWFAPSRPPTCIRQNVCTSLRNAGR